MGMLALDCRKYLRVLMRVTFFTLLTILLDVEFSSAALKAGARRTFSSDALFTISLGILLYLHFIHCLVCVPLPFSLTCFTVSLLSVLVDMHTHMHAHTLLSSLIVVTKCFFPLVN